jgi:cobalt-zinc-cadmium resistance protein CzcA
MIHAVIRFSIRNRAFILLAALLLVGVGVWSATQLPIDAVPDITNRQVVINAAAPALGPEEVERQITFPLEVALGGLPRLQDTRSISQFGLSQVTVIFDDSVDIYFARQLVGERLQEAKDQLPAGVKVEMGPISTGLGEIYFAQVAGGRYSVMERRTMADWIVRPQLLTVPGLSEVNIWGGLAKQYQVLVDPQKLSSYGLSIRDVSAALTANNQNAGGAYITRGEEQQLVRTVGVIRNPDDIRRIVVAAPTSGGYPAGVPITVGQVAAVTEGGAVRQGAITQDGKGEQVYAIAMLLMGENGRIVVERVKDRLVQIQKSLPAGARLVGYFDRSTLIDRTIHTAASNLIEGGALVILVLFLFLLQLRAGLIVSSAIPLSMLGAIIGMKYYGVSANLMSLGAIDFGLIVDGAVIIVENAVRLLAERYKHLGRELTQAEREETILRAAGEVLKPAIFGMGIIIAAYLPILTLSGIEGKMFRPMGLTVIMALLGALLLSLTLIPALCTFFLRVRPERENPGRGEPLWGGRAPGRSGWMERLSHAYGPALQWAMRHRYVMVGGALLFVLLCASLFPRLGSEFIPELDEGAIGIEARFAPSISLEAVIERASALEKRLRDKFPDEVETIMSRIGRSEVAFDPMLVSQWDVWISLTPPEKWKQARTKEELIEKMAREMDQLPGQAGSFSQPMKARMMELIEGVGVRADLGIKLFGADRDVLAREAARLASVVAAVPGATDVKVETTQGLPSLQIRIRRDEIARYGISVADVNDVVEAAVGGKAATVLTTGAQQFEVVVRLAKEYRDDPEKIGRILVPAPSGLQIPLGQLAGIESVEGPVQISRENGQRRVVVQANVRGRDLGSFVQDVQKRLDAQIKLPPGYHLEYGGTYEHLQSGRARLMLVVPITFGLIFLLLFTTFGSLQQAALVFTGIPFAITGGILALFFRGMPFSISAGIGFIALFGVAVLNGVVLVSFINELREQDAPVHEAVLRGCLTRLRPVLMTAAVASIGFIPMAVSHGAGAEVQRPLATVVIGGLITSTLLTLFVLPTLYAWFERGTVRAEGRYEAEE